MTEKISLYSALLRLQKPAGILLLLWPCWWGALAASPAPPYPILAWLAAGSLVMRSAGCIINDLWDRHLDAQVERTRHRPLASGRLAPFEALLLLALLLLVGASVAYALPRPAFVTALAVLPLVILYPLAKRYSRYPQIILALTFNWGVWVGWFSVSPTLTLTPIFLYLAGLFWTMAYDTIYAYQDRADDEKIGVGSTAVTWGDSGVRWVSRFYALMAVCLFAALLSLSASLYHAAAVGVMLGATLALVQRLPFQTDAAVAHRLFVLNASLGGLITLVLGTL